MIVYEIERNEYDETLLCRTMDELQRYIVIELENSPVEDTIIIRKIKLEDGEWETLENFDGWK